MFLKGLLFIYMFSEDILITNWHCLVVEHVRFGHMINSDMSLICPISKTWGAEGDLLDWSTSNNRVSGLFCLLLCFLRFL